MADRGHGWRGCLEGFPLVADPCTDTDCEGGLARGSVA